MVLAHEPAAGMAGNVHASLVSYVSALSGVAAPRSGVWVEHSYARAGRTPRRHPRTLLAAAPAEPGDLIDVVGVPAAPAPPDLSDPRDPLEDEHADDSGSDSEWESRLALLAPHPGLARVSGRVLGVLHDLRLARLAAGPAAPRAVLHDHVVAATAKLRRVLAPAWAWPGTTAWLVSLAAALPPAQAGRLRCVLRELRRVAPRLAARLPPAPAPAPAAPAAAVTSPPASSSGPLLLWLSCSERADTRWEPPLRAAMPTRVVRAPPPAPASPERWCAALAANANAALQDALADVGSRPTILCGFGAGASLAAAVAGALPGGGLAGLALLGPARDVADVSCGTLPALVVVGGAARGRHAALDAGGGRRTLLVEGADAALRLPAHVRRRHRLPQQALDAAVAEEVSQWCREVWAGDAAGDSRAAEPEPEYAHLALTPPPHPAPAAPAPSLQATSTRAIEIVEGRVVTRVSGSTPLLLPPRRAAPSPAPAPADIMQMPIVFADDDLPHTHTLTPQHTPLASPVLEVGGGDSPVTVTSGGSRGGSALKYTRVIVAKRGAGGGAGGGGGTRARPVLLRRALRVVGGRGRPRHTPPSLTHTH